MNLELITVLSSDKLELPAALFTPTKKTNKVAIFLHGNGDSGVFYKTKMINELGQKLASDGIAFLALNNRGARYKKKLIVSGSGDPGKEDTVLGGACYELIEDCVKDIDGAILTLENRGFNEFYLIGFSTGANKICVYDNLSKKNKVSKYIHAGPGDDSGLFYNEIGDKHFWKSLEYSRKMIDNGNPLKVMPKYTGMHPFSAQSAFDILEPNGAYNTFPYFEATTMRLGNKKLFNEYASIEKPMLVVFGEFDEFTYTGGGSESALEILRQKTNKKIKDKSEYIIIKNTDHSFNGKEGELADTIADWLKK